MANTIELQGVEGGLTFEVVGTDMGYRCGYVCIPVGHPLFGVSYNATAPGVPWDRLEGRAIGKRGSVSLFCMRPDEPPKVEHVFDVHGSLTFAGARNTEDDWWLGFDCGHCDDGKDLTLMDPERRRIFGRFGGLEDGEVRTKEYVESECRSLARQIVEWYPASPAGEAAETKQEDRNP